ncbi:hypothetical protein L6452_18542 [Arctium lappa]|uniref:Uncharacterized protein n=1 Tax=Arctium lappa TaxID=4217 RepID=A0ACB9C6D2_ARCLA|nr:hypothetical protein L6452_18542 [Arctium lappa]
MSTQKKREKTNLQDQCRHRIYKPVQDFKQSLQLILHGRTQGLRILFIHSIIVGCSHWLLQFGNFLT